MLTDKHAIKQVDRLLSNAAIDPWKQAAAWVPYVVGGRAAPPPICREGAARLWSPSRDATERQRRKTSLTPTAPSYQHSADVIATTESL